MPAKGRTRNSSWKLRQVTAPSSAPSFNSTVLSRNISTNTGASAASPIAPLTSGLSQSTLPAVTAHDDTSSVIPTVAPAAAASATDTVVVTSVLADTIAPTTWTDTTTSSDQSTQLSAELSVSLAVPAPQDSDPDVATITGPATHRKAFKIPKQHSKTAIGRLTYPVEEIPNFYILKVCVETETKADTVSEWEPIKSRRLRKLALNKWLEHSEIAAIRHTFTVDLREKEGAAYIVARVRDSEHETEIKNRLDNIPSTVPGLKKKAMVDGSRVEQAIRCMVTDNELAADSVERSFKKNLRNITDGKESYTSDLKEISTDFDPLLPFCKRVFSLKPSGYTLNVRGQPFVDDGEQTLHFDFDVVPCISTKYVHEVVLDLVGQNELVTPDLGIISRNLPAVLRILRGLTVRCVYVPGANTEDGKAKAEVLNDDETDRGRVFQIKDIKMPADVPRFTKNNITYSTYGYFKDGK